MPWFMVARNAKPKVTSGYVCVHPEQLVLLNWWAAPHAVLGGYNESETQGPCQGDGAGDSPVRDHPLPTAAEAGYSTVVALSPALLSP